MENRTNVKQEKYKHAELVNSRGIMEFVVRLLNGRNRFELFEFSFIAACLYAFGSHKFGLAHEDCQLVFSNIPIMSQICAVPIIRYISIEYPKR